MPRDFVICENDYSMTMLAQKLGLGVTEAVSTMVATKTWKLTHFEGGFRPMLFDLANDPQELVDLGDSPDSGEVLREMYGHLNRWARRISQRTTMSEADIVAARTASRGKGIVIGVYDEADVPAELTVKYRGRTTVRHDRREKPGEAD